MIHHLARVATTFGLIFCMGCAGMNRPKLPSTLNPSQSPIAYKADDFKKDYDAYKKMAKATSADLDSATQARNEMINRIMLDVESDYKEYEAKLFNVRSGFDTGADVLGLGLSTAATISNGARVKTVLAAALTGVQGTTISISKNYFREKTIEIIISKMQASRNEVKNQIVTKMTSLRVDKYPFEEAWTDLIDFFYAGTLEGGLLSLAADAGSSVTKTTEDQKKSVEQRTNLAKFSIDQLTELSRIRQKFNELYAAHNVTAAMDALTSLGVPPQQNATESQIFRQLNDQIAKAVTDTSVIDKLMVALKLN